MFKPISQLVFCLLFIVSSTTTEAQFFKKLAEKVTEDAERSVTRKTSQKTSKGVEDGFDGIFSSKKSRPKSKLEAATHGLFANTEKPEANYTFKYRYKMQIVAEDQAIAMDYYFQPNSNYLGLAMNQQGVQAFTVFDYDKASVFNFMQHQGRKMLTALNLDSTAALDTENNDFFESEYKVTKLPNKDFLGFSCEGKQLENSERQIIIYYTNKLEISFAQLLKASKQQETVPLNFENHLPNPDETMLMYMKTTEKKRRKKQVATIECTAFDQVNKTFTTAGYQTFGK